MVRSVIPAEIDRHVREAARNRCGYCLSPQHLVMARLEVEHTIPLAKGGTDDETNLWLACPICCAAPQPLSRHAPHRPTPAATPEPALANPPPRCVATSSFQLYTGWIGRQIVKVLPAPSWLATSICPPWRSTISLTTYSPIPMPLMCCAWTFSAR